MAAISLNVKILNGSDVNILTTEETTISNLKTLIEGKVGWPPEEQKLIYCGRVLQDEKTCKESKLENGTALHLVRKSRPIERPEGSMALDESNFIDPGEMGMGPIHGIHIETNPEVFTFPNLGRTPSTEVDPAVAARKKLQLLDNLVVNLRETLEPFGQAIEASRNRSVVTLPDDDSIAESDQDQEMAEACSATSDNVAETVVPSDEFLRQYRSVLMQIMGLTNRIIPWADVISEAVASSSSRQYTAEEASSYQCAFDTMDLIIHHLGHIFHNMSEISIDFAKPPGERALFVHPRPNMEPRAVLSTAAMTIPMTALGVPNIGRLIAQELHRLPVPQQIGGVGDSGPNGHVRRVFGLAAMNSNNNGGENQQANPTDSIAEQIAAFLQQSNGQGMSVNRGSLPQMGNEQGGRANDASAGVTGVVGDTEESDRTFRCGSRLAQATAPAIPNGINEYFDEMEKNCGTPFSFANDMLIIAGNPVIIKIMNFIRGWENEPDELNLFVASVVDRILVDQNDIHMFEKSKLSEGGDNYECLEPFLVARFTETIFVYFSNVREELLKRSRSVQEKFSFLELFRQLLPLILIDIKAIICNSGTKFRFYTKLFLHNLADHLEPYVSAGTRRIIFQEIRKICNNQDASKSRLFKFHYQFDFEHVRDKLEANDYY